MNRAFITKTAGVVWLAGFVGAAPMTPLLEYIQKSWKILERGNHDLARAAVDPKFLPPADGRWPVYIAVADQAARIEQELRASMSPADFEKIRVQALPADLTNIREQGLLYLPKPYVVPGGRFNEMYGWDSYFIVLGLLRAGEVSLARDMADDTLFEIRQYGKVLNANRTYYLTRSQPPFLTEMLLAVYQRTQDRRWLEESLPAIEAYYRYWTVEPHATASTGLSRYFDQGDGPSPEVVSGERDQHGRTVYDQAKVFFRKHHVEDYDASQYYDRRKDQLTPLFYKGDRSMRESGFDPSTRFGPFNVDIIHYNPVCLNSLLYLMESQTADILGILGREAEARKWRDRAADRATRINRLLWDERDGMYYDYNFALGHVRRYPFLTTFYPLWAGIASPEQAARVVRNLPRFECPGGLQTSTFDSGDQWDAPFGWAPLEMIAVEGLHRYGYHREADAISIKFLSLVAQEYRKTGTIDEKYDVVHRISDLRSEIRFGYHSNEVGFGWTNAVFTLLYDKLAPNQRAEVGL
jgi:alpha,alpha-trehalase